MARDSKAQANFEVNVNVAALSDGNGTDQFGFIGGLTYE